MFLILSASAVGVCAGWLSAPAPNPPTPVSEIVAKQPEAIPEPPPAPSTQLHDLPIADVEVEPLPDDVARVLDSLAAPPEVSLVAPPGAKDIPSPLSTGVNAILDKLVDDSSASAGPRAEGSPVLPPTVRSTATSAPAQPPRPLTPQLRLARILRDPLAADLYRRIRTVKLTNSNLRSSLSEQQQSQTLDIAAKVSTRRRAYAQIRPVGYIIGGSPDTFVYQQQQFAYAQQRQQAEEAQMVDAMKRQHAIDNLTIENKILANETLLLGFQREFAARGQTLETLGLLDQPR